MLASLLLSLILDLPVLAMGPDSKPESSFCFVSGSLPASLRQHGKIIVEDSASLLQLEVGGGGKHSLGISQALGSGWYKWTLHPRDDFAFPAMQYPTLLGLACHQDQR